MWVWLAGDIFMVVWGSVGEDGGGEGVAEGRGRQERSRLGRSTGRCYWRNDQEQEGLTLGLLLGSRLELKPQLLK